MARNHPPGEKSVAPQKHDLARRQDSQLKANRHPNKGPDKLRDARQEGRRDIRITGAILLGLGGTAAFTVGMAIDNTRTEIEVARPLMAQAQAKDGGAAPSVSRPKPTPPARVNITNTQAPIAVSPPNRPTSAPLAPRPRGRTNGDVAGPAFRPRLATTDPAARFPAQSSNGSHDSRHEWILSVVSVNDLHGHVEALPAFAGYVGNLRAARKKDKGAVLLVDAGDTFQGTLVSNLVEGRSVVDAYNKLKFDALAIGNHEFDFGPAGPKQVPGSRRDNPRGALLARARQARFPFLAANIRQSKNGKHLSGRNIKTSTLVRRNGTKIGILGLATMRTPEATMPENFVGLEMAPLVETALKEARRLRDRGATVVILLAHTGGSCADQDNPKDLSSCHTGGEIFKLARAIPPGLIDAVVGGHDDGPLAHMVGAVPVIEGVRYGRAFGRVDLVIDKATKRVAAARPYPTHAICKTAATCAATTYETQPVRPSRAMEKLLAPYNRKAKSTTARKLGVELTDGFPRQKRVEGALGNLFADMMFHARPKSDVVINNGGSLRAALPAGPLTYGALYQAMPFDNTFAHIEMTAENLSKAIARNLAEHKNIVGLSGLYANAVCVDGKLEVTLLDDSANVIAPNRKLRVTTNRFLATGGDGLFDGLIDDDAVDIESAPSIRDAMAGAIRKLGRALSPAEFFDANRPRVRYPGNRPVRCSSEIAEGR